MGEEGAAVGGVGGLGVVTGGARWARDLGVDAARRGEAMGRRVRGRIAALAGAMKAAVEVERSIFSAVGQQGEFRLHRGRKITYTER